MSNGDPIARKDGHTTAVYTFGRFQPPTIGHGLLYDEVLRVAEENNADPYVFVSSTVNNLGRYMKCRRYQEMLAAALPKQTRAPPMSSRAPPMSRTRAPPMNRSRRGAAVSMSEGGTTLALLRRASINSMGTSVLSPTSSIGSMAHASLGERPPFMEPAASMKSGRHAASMNSGRPAASMNLGGPPEYALAEGGTTFIPAECFKSIEENQNPLTAEQKIKYLKKMHVGKNISFINTLNCKNMGSDPCPSFVNAAEALLEAGYTRIILLVGSDRVSTFKSVLKDLPALSVFGAGAVRNEKMGGLKGISGTKMRMAAVNKDFDTFKAGIVVGAMTDGDIRDLMNDIRVGMALPPMGGKRTRRRQRKTSRRGF